MNIDLFHVKCYLFPLSIVFHCLNLCCLLVPLDVKRSERSTCVKIKKVVRKVKMLVLCLYFWLNYG